MNFAKIMLAAAVAVGTIVNCMIPVDANGSDHPREYWLRIMKNDESVISALQHMQKINYQNLSIADAEAAITCGDINVSAKMKKSGFDKWNTPVLILKAAESPFVDIMKFLIDNGADYNQMINNGYASAYVLNWAAARSINPEMVKFLIEKNAKYDSAALLKSVCSNEIDDPELLKYLLNKGLDINTKDPYTGGSLLHTAAANGNLKIAKFLISKGMDVNGKDKLGRTPAAMANLRKNYQMVRFLSNHNGSL